MSSFKELKFNSNDFNIIHQNIRSLRSNFEQFVLHLNEIHEKPQLIVLSEIWISDFEVPAYQIEGYNCFAKCNNLKRAGGVIMYVSNVYSCTVNDTYDLQSADMIKLTIDLHASVSISVIGVYRHHFLPAELFFRELEKVLNVSRERNLILIGDINVCTLQNNDVSYEYKIIMASQGLEQYIFSPTRISKNSRTCIDHVFGRSRDNLHYEGISIDLGLTDHHLVLCIVNSCLIEKIPKRPIKPISKVDFNHLEELLSHCKWEEVYSERNVTKAYDMFLEKIKIIHQSGKFPRKLQPKKSHN